MDKQEIIEGGDCRYRKIKEALELYKHWGIVGKTLLKIQNDFMEAAKLKATEIAQQNREPLSMEEKAKHFDNMKPDINNLLWMYLPREVTLDEAEILACVISDILWNPYNYIKPLGNSQKQ